MLPSIIITIFTAAAAICDLIDYRIPNAAIAGGMVCGVITGLAGAGKEAILPMLTGALVPFVICLPLFILSMLGAADIKLLMVCGIFTGRVLVCKIMFTALVIAGFLAAAKLLSKRMGAARGMYFMDYMKSLLLYFTGGKGAGQAIKPYIDREEIKEKRPWLMHLAVPIAAAVPLVLFLLR